MGPAIGSGMTKYTRGTNVLDIREFGASPKADRRTNRQALQAAFDLAAKSLAKNRAGVYIPSGSYQIDKSVYITGQGIDIFGDGPGASTLVGSCTMLHLGMKKLPIDPSQNVLVDAYGTLDSSAAGSPGNRYGLDLSQFRICDLAGPMYRNGDMLWSTMRQFTIDVVVDVTGFTDAAYPTVDRIAICGWENDLGSVPGEPWFVQVQRVNNQYRVFFWLSLAKNPPRESTTYRLATGLVSNPLIRFTAQVDLDGHNGGTGPVVQLFLNRVQIAPVPNPWATSPPSPGGRLLDSFLRPFTLGTSSRDPSLPCKVFGFRVQSGVRYQCGSAGDSQAYVGGGTINDRNQFFASGTSVRFMVPFLEKPADVADHPSMMVAGASGTEPVPLSSKNSANSELVPFGLVGATVSNLGLASAGYGAGILMSGTTNSQFSDLRIQGMGVALATYGFSNYSNVHTRLDLDARAALVVLRRAGILYFSDINSKSSAPWVFLSADRYSGGAFENWVVSPNTATVHYVYSEGASFLFRNFTTDNEGYNLLGCCEFYFGAVGEWGGASVEFEWTNGGTGSYRRPMIVLGGPSVKSVDNSPNRTAFFSLKSQLLCGERSQPARIRVDCPYWHGELRNDAVYERGPLVLDNTVNEDSRVKVEESWMNGPPRSGYWSKGTTTIHPPDVVSGRRWNMCVRRQEDTVPRPHLAGI